jgi:hypothetical protein
MTITGNQLLFFQNQYFSRVVTGAGISQLQHKSIVPDQQSGGTNPVKVL